ncbi:GH92 family glycosyl hydrolase [Streptomyces sp. H27-D2]|uniref:GH92 family glycosyl hydrolase n=1 Tax=Streptomyces sp. H27-D2 TaxID=3046304 RepID=UPI002DBCA4B4|nr:GH92 family glycosyl hydrolase [Streptomyces sp. H27-D2]MEC4019985.1 GH92 family glycosyl hydrolase [Streptomyces sp. H27-D2]
MKRGHTKRRRWCDPARPAALLAAVVLLATVQGTADAAPRQPAKATEKFASSFESGQPQPSWSNTVETGRDGEKKASGVNGGYSSGIPGNVTDQVTEVRASGENTAGGEVKENLVDGEAASKWLVFEKTAWLEFDLADPVKVVRYALTSANDAAERDPRDWTLRGSENGKDWTALDTRADQTFDKRQQTKEFAFENSKAYQHYRLEIDRTAGADLIQLADVQFSNGDTSTPTPADMRSTVDSGPTGSPTAKAHAGFTGAHALRYAGTHEPDGRAYSYNKVFDVDTLVTRSTSLSYRVFPSMPESDPKYPATHVSLDLAFTDGTYLSDLTAVDQHGARLTPRGQAASKTLYVNQWNHKESRIGQVAAGRTIDRVLVAYDSPKGPAKFRGWVDDVSIAPKAAEKPLAHVSDYAETTRGTNSSGAFSRGNNFPATAVPNGFNFWTPVTNAASTDWLYDYARSNNDDNLPTLQAFSASHEPSPWMGDRQTFQIMPSVAAGTPNASRKARALPFRHDKETARPHYYGVTFENGLKTEITPSDHAAMMRFTFPGKDASVVLDNVSNEGGLSLDAERGVVTGFSDVKSGGSTGATRLFVYGVFDAPVTDSGRLEGGGGKDVTGFLRFKPGADRTVNLRIATSLIGAEQAKANLEQEIPASASFGSVKTRAQAAWDDILGVIEVEGASRDQLSTLYSNLYRLYLYPNSGFENTGSKAKPKRRYASPFSPPSGENTPTETGAKIVDGEVYVNNGFWDTYRTTWPAYSLLTPERAGKMADGFVQQYKDGGWISRWSSPGYSDLMTGTSSDVAFADAYNKGVKFDAKSAYEAALKNATVAPPSPGVGRKGMDTSVFLGYTATDTKEGMSWALEGYLNDFGLAQMGEALYKKTKQARYQEESAYFRNRAQNYVKMFDPKVDFFQGKTRKGDWRLTPDTYDPRVWGHDYTETNGWNFAFTAPQDTRGLANLYGGKAAFGKKLDAFFDTPETGSAEFAGSYGGVIHEMTEARDVRMGMYGHSNQVSHHIGYMYDAAGRPWKTQQKVREVLSRLYLGSEIGQGYPGDEDNGEMSAWYVFSSLGFYPLVMGSPEYAIGSPLFTKATVHLENGRDLVVKAPKNSAQNVYVQGLKVNGKTWKSTALPHKLLAKGGRLEFAMGPKPSSWGTGENAGPSSITQGDQAPTPMDDAIGEDTDITLTGGDDGAKLIDDSSGTDTSFDSAQLKLAAPAKALHYTLTSATKAKAPAGWVLKGSKDGEEWKVLDRRADQSFAWDKQTRSFAVRSPGSYAHYRLEPVGGGAGLAEIELLS